MTRSAPSTAAALVSTTWSAKPELGDALARRGGARGRDDRAHRALRARRARDRRADQADADQRQAVEDGSVRSRRLPHELRQRLDHQPIGLLAADASCAAHSAACRRRRGAGSGRAGSGTRRRPRRSCPWRSGKWISTKLATLGVTSRPSLRDLLASATRSHLSLCARALLDMRGVLDRRDAGRDRRRVDIERPADAVDAHRRHAPARTASRAAAPRGRGFSRTCAVITTFSEVATSSMPAS